MSPNLGTHIICNVFNSKHIVQLPKLGKLTDVAQLRQINWSHVCMCLDITAPCLYIAVLHVGI